MQLRINYNNSLFQREVKQILFLMDPLTRKRPEGWSWDRFPLTVRGSPFMMNAARKRSFNRWPRLSSLGQKNSQYHLCRFYGLGKSPGMIDLKSFWWCRYLTGAGAQVENLCHQRRRARRPAPPEQPRGGGAAIPGRQPGPERDSSTVNGSIHIIIPDNFLWL